MNEWMNEWMNDGIYVRPSLIEAYHEGAVCPPYARLNSSVFSLLQKPANVRVESRIVNGSEFQSEWPEVAKLRDPYILSPDPLKP